jgi:hypothetical protein
LRNYGRDYFLNHSILGGDLPGGFLEEGVWVDGTGKVLHGWNGRRHARSGNSVDASLDPEHNIQQQVYDAFAEDDRLRAEIEHGGDVTEDDDNVADITTQLEKLDKLSAQASRSVYQDSSISIVSAIIVLINMSVIHGVSNAFVDELLKYLSSILLPTDNSLPHSHYVARKLIRKLGLNYELIHSCPSGCVLYRDEYKDLTVCPKQGCGKSRYIAGSTVILARVLRFFPFIPRVLRMFCSPAIAELLRHHINNPNEDAGVMKYVANSPTWKHIDSDVDRNFGDESRNLRLGLSLDGVNLFPHSNTTHSTWPILLLIYNLPPYLVTKKIFIQLCLLISGKGAPTSENIGVFMRPLLDELQKLWTGVTAQDFSLEQGRRRFNLRGILMWTVCDYPALDLISGLQTHGYKACVVCGPETQSRSAKCGNKLDGEKKVKAGRLYLSLAYVGHAVTIPIETPGISTALRRGEHV